MSFGYISEHRKLPLALRRAEAKMQLDKRHRTPCIVETDDAFLNPNAHRMAFLSNGDVRIKIKDAQAAVRRQMNCIDDFEVHVSDPSIGAGFVIVNKDASTSSSEPYLAAYAVIFSNESDNSPNIVEVDPEDPVEEVYRKYHSNDMTLYLSFSQEEHV